MKRRIGKLAWIVLLGVIANVIVAWVVALSFDGVVPGSSSVVAITAAQQSYWNLMIWQRPGTTVISSGHQIPSPPVPPRSDAGQAEIAAWLKHQEAFLAGKPTPPPEGALVMSPPSWSRATRPPPAGKGNAVQIFEDARGWPLRSLLAQTRTDLIAAGISPSFTDSWRIDIGGTTALGFQRGLPLKPIWPGFMINTLMYAAVIWLIVSLFIWQRKVVRARAGRCTRCGYDMRGQAGSTRTCPECGLVTITRR